MDCIDGESAPLELQDPEWPEPCYSVAPMRYLLTILMLSLLPHLGAAQPLDETRAAFASASSAAAVLAKTRQEVAKKHERLGAEIAALKAAVGSLGPSMSKVELSDRLQRSRQLAEALEALDREAVEASERLDRARSALQSTLDSSLIDRQRALATAAPANRRAQFEAIRSLLAERTTLTAAPKTVGVELPAAVSEASTPEELRELADEAQDNAEKVRTRLDALDERLRRLRQRRRLLSAAVAFQNDTGLFADNQRNRRIVTRPAALRTARAGRGGQAEADVGAADRSPTAVAGIGGNAPAGDGHNAPAPAADGAQRAEGEPEGSPEGQEFAGAADPDQDADQAGAGGADDSPPAAEMEAEAVADADGQGAFFPSPVAVVHDVDAPGAPADLGRALVIEDIVDPQLLDGQLDGLSSGAVSGQIRSLERNRARLRKAAIELELRRKALREAAEDLEMQ